METSKPIYSEAVNLPRQKDQRYGKTIGTVKLYDTAKPDKPSLPIMNGYILIEADKLKIIEKNGKRIAYCQIALWEPKQPA